MELRHLRYFIAVAEELHFRRASERLHIAQPALSRQIQSLEHELQMQLFFRTKRRVQLTPAGMVLLEQVRSVFERLHEGIEVAQRANQGQMGCLSLDLLVPQPMSCYRRYCVPFARELQR